MEYEIEKRIDKSTKDGKKYFVYLLVEQGSGKQIWASHFNDNPLDENGIYEIETETKGDFTNIKSAKKIKQNEVVTNKDFNNKSNFTDRDKHIIKMNSMTNAIEMSKVVAGFINEQDIKKYIFDLADEIYNWVIK